MFAERGRFVAVVFLALCGIAGLLWSTAGSMVAAEEIPKQLSDDAFWKLVTDFSEPGGYFRSDNFVSNEMTFQDVIPRLKKDTKPGGVYLGVGPDQNFTYIVALQPKIAFIFDIRRQNMMEHLMYKALIETSSDRVDFASRLFARKRPSEIQVDAAPEALFKAFAAAEPDEKLAESNLKVILDRLEVTHGFKLSNGDRESIQYVYKSFVAAGPDINYNFSAYRGGRGGRGGRMPAYADLMLADDGQGLNRSYMANEENFQALKSIEKNNLIVPLVGDFAGDKAIRAVGKYLKDHDATVTAFYLSNVEQYLFQDPENWKKFYSTVGTLPLDSTSTFIRSAFNMNNGFSSSNFGSMTSINLLCPMPDLLKAFKAGHITRYSDVLNMSK